MNPSTVSIVWFRQDLRLADNPALSAAARAGAVVPVYLWAPAEEGDWRPGPAGCWWLDRSLRSLERSLRLLGSRLVIRKGRAADELSALVRLTGASRVYWNRRHEPAAVRRDERVRERLSEEGIRVEEFDSSVLHDPLSVRTKAGGPYTVYTPFYRACQALPEPATAPALPKRVQPPASWPVGLLVDDLRLQSALVRTAALEKTWTPGEAGAGRRLKRFATEALASYSEDRDRPALEGTSALSPHLHFGEISPAVVLRAVRTRSAAVTRGGSSRGEEKFTSELYWREFAYHLLRHHPRTSDSPLRESFDRMPWRTDRRSLRAWQEGRTGYPFVDAGMRQLRTVGWMHNRVRMVAASFLVKHLLVSWREGAKWFWRSLVDADLASNTLGWQWVAGCGADAAPFFRVFNPVTQSRTFDPEGGYLRKWIPELGRLASPYIHCPWEAPSEALRLAGVRLGKDYPRPIIAHAAARRRALGAYEKTRTRSPREA